MDRKNIHELIVRYLQNELTLGQKEELDQWVALSDNNRQLFEQLKQKEFIGDELKKVYSYDDQKGWNTIKAYLNEELNNGDVNVGKAPKPAFRLNVFKRLAVAACILPFLIGGYWLFIKNNSVSPPTKPEQNTVSAPLSSKSRIELPDHSVVILNKGSVISYNEGFGVIKREVHLTGEAFFDVKSNKDLPMVVIAGPLRIKEVGTAFNVRAYADEPIVETSLIHGEIQVSTVADPNNYIVMHPNEKIAWKKEQIAKLPIEKTKSDSSIAGNLQVDKIKPNPTDNSINEIAWVQDKLSFSHEQFFSLAQKMERWYRVSFIFKDENSKKLFFTGSLEKESLQEAMEALSKVASFEYAINERTVTIQQK